jgi:DNA replicative helicase MCM subunit Mcm2 (Cdc46/Mcm family)
LIYVFRKPKDENSIREYAYKKSQLEDRKIPDYHNYLQKHILYSKRINPILSEEAKVMLNEYWIRIAKDFGSPRILETLFRLPKAIARLKLKEIVDAKDAREAMQYYNVNLQQYQQVVSIPDNPRDIAYSICVNILSETKSPISLEELIIAASKRNEQIKHYLGDELKLRYNWKIRSILDMLLNHESIKRIQEKPMILLWVTNNADIGNSTLHTTTHTPHSQQRGDKECEVCDACDEQNKEDDNDKRFKCFHCEEHFSNDAERVNHIGYEHQGKMIYPEPEDFEGRLEK